MALAHFSTWTTYGTWLRGDPRGWYRPGSGIQAPNPELYVAMQSDLAEPALVLDLDQRRLVEQTVADHCSIRGWRLHAVTCRSNHVHVVVSAPDRPIELPREQFKYWCTRRLKATSRAARENWWTERGWDEYVDDEKGLAEVIEYVLERQDWGSGRGTNRG
jgi:REP element-mobilizing transposase RayT